MFSVIIPAYVPQKDSAAGVLAGLLRAVRAVIATMPSPQWVELLVQDDASPGLVEWDGVLPGMVKYARNAENLGFAGNCNAGAARAQGRYLLFLNQDCYPLPGWYDAILAAFNVGAAVGQSVGLIGPKLLFPPLEGAPAFPLRLQSCGGWYDAVRQPFHRYLGFCEDYPEANVCEEVSWVTGAAHVWERAAFERIGGYDTAYEGGYFEDVDASCRVQEAGYHVWYAPDARFLHTVATSGGVKPEQFRANMTRFWQRWVATGKVSPDTSARHESWW